jgi:hypothetical protein
MQEGRCQAKDLLVTLFFLGVRLADMLNMCSLMPLANIFANMAAFFIGS